MAVKCDPVFHRLRARSSDCSDLIEHAWALATLLSRSVRPLPWSYFSLPAVSSGSIGSEFSVGAFAAAAFP
eukprot:750752-Hanusia_phi.AAC.1